MYMTEERANLAHARGLSTRTKTEKVNVVPAEYLVDHCQQAETRSRLTVRMFKHVVGYINNKTKENKDIWELHLVAPKYDEIT